MIYANTPRRRDARFSVSNAESSNGNALLDNLLLPGRLIVFVDDSATDSKQRPPNLAADFECLCGLEMTSEAHAKAIVMAPPIPHGIEEFHAVDILNPSNPNPWKGVSARERADVLRGLFMCVQGCAKRIYHGFYSGEQMRDTPEMIARPQLMAEGPKSALETVFRNCLVPHLLGSAIKPVIVWDSGKNATEKMKVEELRWPDSYNTCEIMHTDSRFVFGLQLADLVAYSYNRRFRIKYRAEQGTANELDEAILDGLLLLTERFVEVLDLPDSQPL